MKDLHEARLDYLRNLKERAQNTRVTTSHQLIGLSIATTLRDMEHRALYIKLAKEGNPDYLLSLAKSIAEKPDIKNHGAYFMRLVKRSAPRRGTQV